MENREGLRLPASMRRGSANAAGAVYGSRYARMDAGIPTPLHVFTDRHKTLKRRIVCYCCCGQLRGRNGCNRKTTTGRKNKNNTTCRKQKSHCHVLFTQPQVWTQFAQQPYACPHVPFVEKQEKFLPLQTSEDLAATC